MLSLATAVFRPFTGTSFLMAAWLLVMVAVPAVRWVFGPGTERSAITAGVLAQVAAVCAALVVALGPASIAVMVLVPLMGWSSEVLGSRTGFPFGRYHYTDVLQPQVAGVPVLIPLAWLMMVPPSWAVAVLLAPDHPPAQWIIAAAAFTAWDFYLDPQMVRWDFWRWERKGAYLGIPLVNFAGWFGVSLAITVLFWAVGEVSGVRILSSLPIEPLVLVYLLTWVLQFIGQFVFWRMRVSAVVGLLLMGGFALAVLLRLA